MSTYIVPVRWILACKVTVVADTLQDAFALAKRASPSELEPIADWIEVEQLGVEAYGLKGRHGHTLLPGMLVAVPKPAKGDPYEKAFLGTVHDCHQDPVVVAELDGTLTHIVAERLTIVRP